MIVSKINIPAIGFVVICSSSISHNFGLEGPIPTIQAFFYIAGIELIHMEHLNHKCFFPSKFVVIVS